MAEILRRSLFRSLFFAANNSDISKNGTGMIVTSPTLALA
jgi:hypothetical protein